MVPGNTPRTGVANNLTQPGNTRGCVVVSEGTLSGIVDFGGMFAGDPAWDLAAAWVLLPAGTASRFFDMYAHADEAAIRRARGLAAMKSSF